MFGGSEIRRTRGEYVDNVPRNMENAYEFSLVDIGDCWRQNDGRV